MLTPRLLTSPEQAAVYFELDDYYVAGHQVAPSSWWGEGARRMGLAGEIDRRTFADLLAGRLPTGDTIAKGGTGSHRPGIDLTFSAPKSVSLAALVGGDERILSAHERAVNVALRYIEETAPRARSRQQGILRLETSDNLLVARFNHDSSRASDPQLHTHAVVLNVTQRKDGAWKALHNDQIFRSTKTAGTIYRAELARELRRLGYGIERTHGDGRFEIVGIARDQLEAFSQRRKQILEHLEERGLEGHKAGDVAARTTRDKKRHQRRSLLQQTWTQRADEVGIEFDRLPKFARTSSGLAQTAAREAVDHAIAHLTERQVVASEQKLLQVALAFGVGKARLRDVQRELEGRIERHELVHATSSKQKDPFARHFTTDAALAVEQDLLQMMEASQKSVAPILDPESLESAMDRIQTTSPYPLTKGQEAAIRLALSTEDRLVGIQGYAGTGKTSGALRHIRQLAEGVGFEVKGFAPSAAAAEVLVNDAGIESITLAKLLTRKREPPSRSTKKQLWIVDEVSMMGNETAHALLRLAKKHNARLIWVGDRDQLPAIEAGRAFGLLMDKGLAVAHIDSIVRQEDLQLRDAVRQTIAREHGDAVDLLRPRIVAIADRETRLRAVADAFLALPDCERESTLAITPSNADRRRINALIRHGLKKTGVLDGEQLDAEILVGRNATAAQRADAAHYRPGDVVRFNRAYRRLGVERGEYFAVESVDLPSDAVTLRSTDGRRVPWKPRRAAKVEIYEAERRTLMASDLIRWTRNDNPRGRYNAETAQILAVDLEHREAHISVGGHIQTLHLDRDRHWEHAYASTVHAAQGRTADRVLLHLDTRQGQLMGHESWYVAISRARKDLRLFTDDIDRLPRSITTPLEQDSALEVIRDARARQHAEARIISPELQR